jgi:hypothetical protein
MPTTIRITTAAAATTTTTPAPEEAKTICYFLQNYREFRNNTINLFTSC